MFRLTNIRRRIIISGIWFCSLIFVAQIASAPRPPLGWSTRCEVIDVYDGDTVTVEVRRLIKVRLIDCWAPELREDGGIESRDHLRTLLEGKDVVLHIPGNNAIWRMFSFSRILGRLWAGDQEISERMVLDGHATRYKGGND